jgi:hypothetical protein
VIDVVGPILKHCKVLLPGVDELHMLVRVLRLPAYLPARTGLGCLPPRLACSRILPAALHDRQLLRLARFRCTLIG